MITAAGRMLMTFGRGMLRQTKHLSPYKTSVTTKVIGTGKKATTQSSFMGIKNTAAKTMKTKQDFSGLGKYSNKGLKKIGVSATKRNQIVSGYNTGYKHLSRNKKRYASALGGAAAWDMMSDDD